MLRLRAAFMGPRLHLVPKPVSLPEKWGQSHCLLPHPWGEGAPQRPCPEELS